MSDTPGAVFHEGPFLRVTEVGWGGRVGILRAKVTTSNNFFLKRVTPATPAPINQIVFGGSEDTGQDHTGGTDDPIDPPIYVVGDEIKKKRYTHDFIEGIDFDDHGGPGELIYDRWGGPPFIYSVASAGFGTIPDQGPTEDHFYHGFVLGDQPSNYSFDYPGVWVYHDPPQYFNGSYLSFTERLADHPLNGLPAIELTAASIGAELITVDLLSDVGLIDPVGNYTASVANWGTGTLNHIYTDPYKYGHANFNSYVDPQRSGWYVYKIPYTDHPYPGLGTKYMVWLINFAKLGLNGKVDLGSLDFSWSTPPYKDISFNCEFDLKIYNSGKFFVGDDRTITRVGSAAVYSQTKTIDWRTFGNSLKSINKNGWIEAP